MTVSDAMPDDGSAEITAVCNRLAARSSRRPQEAPVAPWRARTTAYASDGIDAKKARAEGLGPEVFMVGAQSASYDRACSRHSVAETTVFTVRG